MEPRADCHDSADRQRSRCDRIRPRERVIYFLERRWHDVDLPQDTPTTTTLVENVKTQSGARTMALDQKTGRAFLFRCGYGPGLRLRRAARSVGAYDPRQLLGSGNESNQSARRFHQCFSCRLRTDVRRSPCRSSRPLPAKAECTPRHRRFRKMLLAESRPADHVESPSSLFA